MQQSIIPSATISDGSISAMYSSAHLIFHRRNMGINILSQLSSEHVNHFQLYILK
jgi:hypothetical protein